MVWLVIVVGAEAGRLRPRNLYFLCHGNEGLDQMSWNAIYRDQRCRLFDLWDQMWVFLVFVLGVWL